MPAASRALIASQIVGSCAVGLVGNRLKRRVALAAGAFVDHPDDRLQHVDKLPVSTSYRLHEAPAEVHDSFLGLAVERRALQLGCWLHVAPDRLEKPLAQYAGCSFSALLGRLA
jgi:hypothetical protein